MFSRAPQNSRSATSVRRRPSGGATRERPKSDTSARTQKKPSVKKSNEKDEKRSPSAGKIKESEVSAEEILENCQEKDYACVFEINLHAQKLTRIPDIEQFTKLRILDVSCNQIPTIWGLENCSEMRELKLYSNKLEVISGLERLKELNNLLLHHNRIKTIGKSLQHVRKLKILRLDSNLLSAIDHREIGCCSQLAVLDISNNRMTNISAVNSLSVLEELDVSANRLTKIPDISRCKHLQELDLSRNHINDISGLRDISSLAILRLEHNQLTSLSAVGKLRSLQELYVDNNRLSSLENFNQQFPSLEVLNICHNNIPSFETLSHLSQSNLAELYIAGNPCVKSDTTGYQHEIHRIIPSLEMVDGVSLKRPTLSREQSKPLMRPMSSSHILSSRQVEEQLKAAMLEQCSFEESITSRFSLIRDLFDTLPTEPPKPHQFDEQVFVALASCREGAISTRDRPCSADRPVSRCSSRSRIADARAFAAEHFHPDQD